jgi:hypothetical protein
MIWTDDLFSIGQDANLQPSEHLYLLSRDGESLNDLTTGFIKRLYQGTTSVPLGRYGVMSCGASAEGASRTEGSASCRLTHIACPGWSLSRRPETNDHGKQVYYLCMAKSKSYMAFEVTCPHCKAALKVDPDTKAVIAHTPPAVPKTFNDFEEAARAMRDQEGRKESIFRQSVEAEKNKASLLEKKFQEALKRAKETPDTGPKIRDFDLD